MQPGQQILAWSVGRRRCGNDGPVRVLGSGGGQAMGHVGEIEVGMLEEVLVQAVGLGSKRRGAAGGNRPEP
uniref:Uncharacterized protein n=1 Tax=Mycobacterium riyadhense TaxID=486698 RepID=A0A653EUP9_9MYCO|nr:hypothetical protein BIN_B_03958 [Mycobacterium riyadhense]